MDLDAARLAVLRDFHRQIDRRHRTQPVGGAVDFLLRKSAWPTLLAREQRAEFPGVLLDALGGLDQQRASFGQRCRPPRRIRLACGGDSLRSEESRVGKECVGTCRYGCARVLETKKHSK